MKIDALAAKSAARTAADPEYAYIREDVARMKEQLEKNSLSLNLAERTRERTENEARNKERNAKRKEAFAALLKDEQPLTKVFKLTLDNIAAATLEEQSDFTEDKSSMRRSETDEDGEPIEPDDSPTYPFGFDPAKREALAITTDLVQAAGAKPATVKVP